MLILISPSWVSTMPCIPTLPLPAIGLAPAPLLPLTLPDSLGAVLPPPLIRIPLLLLPLPLLLPGREPQGATSRWSGLCRIGELCTLIPGLTARLLKLPGSKSSSRRRLLLIRLVISAALGGCGPTRPEYGVLERCESLPLVPVPAPAPAPVAPGPVGRVLRDPMKTSSLKPDEEPRGRTVGGGGVVRLPPRLLDSDMLSQKYLVL
jgi:hypothetical protein